MEGTCQGDTCRGDTEQGGTDWGACSRHPHAGSRRGVTLVHVRDTTRVGLGRTTPAEAATASAETLVVAPHTETETLAAAPAPVSACVSYSSASPYYHQRIPILWKYGCVGTCPEAANFAVRPPPPPYVSLLGEYLS